MKIGTRTILFGTHLWFLHPWYVAKSWRKLHKELPDIYVKPTWRHYIAFFVHDLGYWGKPNLDGPEGEEHVMFGANLCHKLFETEKSVYVDYDEVTSEYLYKNTQLDLDWEWWQFCACHSRFMAKKLGLPYSTLCVADKLAITMYPKWLYLMLGTLSGEIKEYMSRTEKDGKYEHMGVASRTTSKWFDDVIDYMKQWVNEHKDMRQDLWTKI